ncbi:MULTISPECIES: hypothetical protein [Methylosinus]|nr:MULTISPECIES: hypothetical protein [Methylosinus]
MREACGVPIGPRYLCVQKGGGPVDRSVATGPPPRLLSPEVAP